MYNVDIHMAIVSSVDYDACTIRASHLNSETTFDIPVANVDRNISYIKAGHRLVCFSDDAGGIHACCLVFNSDEDRAGVIESFDAIKNRFSLNSTASLQLMGDHYLVSDSSSGRFLMVSDTAIVGFDDGKVVLSSAGDSIEELLKYMVTFIQERYNDALKYAGSVTYLPGPTSGTAISVVGVPLVPDPLSPPILKTDVDNRISALFSKLKPNGTDVGDTT